MMNIIIGTLMKYKKILTTRDYNSINNKTLLILNSIDDLWDWAIFNTTVIIQHSNYRHILKKNLHLMVVELISLLTDGENN